jgi:hypothetical protein
MRSVSTECVTDAGRLRTSSAECAVPWWSNALNALANTRLAVQLTPSSGAVAVGRPPPDEYGDGPGQGRRRDGEGNWDEGSTRERSPAKGSAVFTTWSAWV